MALVLFLIAAFNVPSRVNLIAAGLACWVASIIITGVHPGGLALASSALQASLIPMAATGAPAPAMDPVAFQYLVSIVLGVVSSILLKYAPANWKGKPMVAAAVAFSFALGLAQLYVTGQLAHLDWTDAASFGFLVASQQVFFNTLKDDWHLADPPSPTISPSRLPGS